MGQNSGVERFGAAFMQIHLASVLFSLIVYRAGGTLHSLASYLVSVHLLAAEIYILDIQSSRVLSKIIVKTLVLLKSKIPF